MVGGSWTNNLSWVKGYENLLGPMEEVSALFYEKALKPAIPADKPCYRNALSICSASKRAITATGAKACGPITVARSAAAARKFSSTIVRGRTKVGFTLISAAFSLNYFTGSSPKSGEVVPKIRTIGGKVRNARAR
jgi:hypothetical protein